MDEQSPIVCVGGMNGRKVIFVDVLSGEALSEIAVGSQSMSSSSAARLGVHCWENLELVLCKRGCPADCVRVAETSRVNRTMVTVIVTGDGAVTRDFVSNNTRGALTNHASHFVLNDVTKGD